MKPYLLPLLFFLPAMSFGQDYSYEVVKTGNKYSLDILNSAFSKAKFCGRINPSASYMIKFDDGAEVKILSASESMVSEKSECVREKDVDESIYTWSISANGTIIKLQSVKPSKSHE
jgi:hypothetical protein